MNPVSKLRSYGRRIVRIEQQLAKLSGQVEDLQYSLGRLEVLALRSEGSKSLSSFEVKAFSQWGEDGIIQALLRHVPIQNKVFIEFGVQDYTESNTRFLLRKDNWTGLIIDGSNSCIDAVTKQDVYWRHDLRCEAAFVEPDNVNDIFRRNGIEGDIGLLSVDIDGMDYWVLNAIDCVSPRILIVEYNGLFGPDIAVSIPYSRAFDRTRTNWTWAYWGASLAAFRALADRRGYALVGSNSAGSNAFFVRRDVLSHFPELSAREAYVRRKFREVRDPKGQIQVFSDSMLLSEIANLPLITVSDGVARKIGEILTLPDTAQS